jgi:hypothetical protein
LAQFAIDDREELKYNADNWLSLYLQCKSPGADKESNCSPVSNTRNPGVTMCLYAPKAEALDRRWAAKAVKRLK